MPVPERFVLLTCLADGVWPLSVWIERYVAVEHSIHAGRAGCSFADGYGSKIFVEVKNVTADGAAHV